MRGSTRRGAAVPLLLLIAASACAPDAPEAPETSPEPALAAPVEQDTPPAYGVRQQDMSRLVVRALRAADEVPLAGIRIRLLWQAGDDQSSVGRIYQETGADGAAHFEILGGTIVQSVAAEPTALTAPAAVVVKKPVVAGQEASVELRLAPAATLAGVVLDAAGTPVVGAEVQVWFDERWTVERDPGRPFDVTARSREGGYFMVGGLPRGDFLLEARADGLIASRRVAGKIDTAQVLDDFELVLESAEPYFGKVLDEDGSPVAGAQVIAGRVGRFAAREPTATPQAYYVPSREYQLTTDEHGAFTVPARPSGEMWVVEVFHESFQKARMRLLPGDGAGDVVLVRGFDLAGQVVDEGGAPVARPFLRLRGEVEREQRGQQDGSFLLQGLGEDLEAALLVHKPGYTPALLWPFEIGPARAERIVRLAPGASLAGAVVGPGGEGRAGLRVQVVEDPPADAAASLPFPGAPPLASFGLDQAITAASGSFLLADLPARPLRLRVLAEDGTVLREFDATPGGAELRLVLE